MASGPPQPIAREEDSQREGPKDTDARAPGNLE